MYAGVGRMFLLQTRDETTAKLGQTAKENETSIADLAKSKTYLERVYKESEESLRELLRNR